MANPENKQIPYESTQKDIRDAIESVATAIGGIAIPSADHVSYDNSVSGLSATDVQNAIDELSSEKVDKEAGKGLSTNDYTDAEKTKLAGIEAGAEVNPTSSAKTATESFETVDGGLLSKCQINLVPVQSGSGDPSPDNVRPISGHTEVDLYNVGKNRLIPNLVSETKNGVTLTVHNDGTITLNGLATATTQFYNALTNITKVEIGESYILSGCPSGGSGTTYALRPMKTSSTWYSDDFGNGVTFTADSTNLFINIIIRNGYNCNNMTFKPMLRKASVTATPYEPYLGHLYTVQIGSTVYGGYVDLVSGVMIATHAIIDLGSLTWTKDASKTFYVNLSNSKSGLQNMYCEALTPYPESYKLTDYSLYPDNIIARNQNATYIYTKCTTYENDTATAFKTAMSGVDLVYELETYQTIQLTPQQIEALVGQNNLSTPLDGQSIETNGVEYKELFTFADVKEYVDKKIPDAPTTDGTYTLQAVVSGGVPTYSWV